MNTDMMIKSPAAEEIVTRWVAAFGGPDLGALRQFCSNDVVVHANAPGENVPEGLDRVLLALQVYRAAFPDATFAVESMYSKGERLCCRWSARGINRRPFLHMPATNREVLVHGTCQFRFVDGVVVEHWFDFDLYEMYDQLGALLPAPGEASPASQAITDQAMKVWSDALATGHLGTDGLFSDDLLVHSVCFQQRSMERGPKALVDLLSSIQARLSDIRVSIDDRISQGVTSTYRTRLTARPANRPGPAAFKMYCMFTTAAGAVSGMWIRLWRRS